MSEELQDQDKKTPAQEAAEEKARQQILHSLESYLGDRYYGEKRIKLLKEINENAETACMPVGAAARIASRTDLFEDHLPDSLTDSGFVNLQLVYAALQIPTGEMMINAAMKERTMACATDSLTSPYLGVFDPESNGIFVKIEKLKDRDVSPLEVLTFYEELSHSYQMKTKHLTPTEKEFFDKHYKQTDLSAFSMFIEADAKVNAALMIMEHTDGGNNYLRQILLDSKVDPDLALFNKVNELYEKHGLAELRKHPELLRPAFETFFSDKKRVEDYGDTIFRDGLGLRNSDPKLYERILSGTRDFLTSDRFMNAFGKRYGYDIHSREEIFNMLPPDLPFTKWVKGEMSFLDAAKESGFDIEPPKPVPPPPQLEQPTATTPPQANIGLRP